MLVSVISRIVRFFSEIKSYRHKASGFSSLPGCVGLVSNLKHNQRGNECSRGYLQSFFCWQ